MPYVVQIYRVVFDQASESLNAPESRHFQDLAYKFPYRTSFHRGTHHTVCPEARINVQQTYNKDDVQYTNTIHSKRRSKHYRGMLHRLHRLQDAVIACVATPLPRTHGPGCESLLEQEMSKQ